MTDWSKWSHEAVELMQTRNREWPRRCGIEGVPYQWDLQTGKIKFRSDSRSAEAELCVVGTVSQPDGLFGWAWHDPAIPEISKFRLQQVLEFGELNDLDLLMSCTVEGGHAQALELLCISGRILDADGVFIDSSADTNYYFTLHHVRCL